MTMTNLLLAVTSGAVIAQESPIPLDPVEKYGTMGAFGLLLWWLMQTLSKKVDENTQSIKELAHEIRESMKKE